MFEIIAYSSDIFYVNSLRGKCANKIGTEYMKLNFYDYFILRFRPCLMVMLFLIYFNL